MKAHGVVDAIVNRGWRAAISRLMIVSASKSQREPNSQKAVHRPIPTSSPSQRGELQSSVPRDPSAWQPSTPSSASCGRTVETREQGELQPSVRRDPSPGELTMRRALSPSSVLQPFDSSLLAIDPGLLPVGNLHGLYIRWGGGGPGPGWSALELCLCSSPPHGCFGYGRPRR